MVFISNGKTTCFGLLQPSSGFDNFLAIRVLYNMSLLARNVSKPEDGRYRSKHVVFPLLINTIIQPYFIVVFLAEFTSPYGLNIQRGRHTSDGTPQNCELDICETVYQLKYYAHSFPNILKNYGRIAFSENLCSMLT